MSITKEQHDELKKQFDAVTLLLKAEHLSAEDKIKFETLKAQIAGALMSSWLPADNIRRLIMSIVAIAVIYFFVQSSYVIALVLLVILCMFSPRIVGEAAVLIGKAKGN